MMQDISASLKGRIGSVPTMKHIKGGTCVTTSAFPRPAFHGRRAYAPMSRMGVRTVKRG